jgi:NAD(P)-dependent dehydrogenase (short-subunit alcohol dehydrogenase family)
MNGTFDGKVALVAGGTGALGRAVSLAFLAEGARVMVTYRKPEELADLRAAAGANGSRLEEHVTDVTDGAAVEALIAGIVTRHGALDVLVNCVGGFTGGKRLWEEDARVLDRMLDSNLRSGYAISRAAVPPMLERGRGVIVNVASKAAIEHGPGIAAYAASKAAAVALLDSLAGELKGTGVRVNSILPSIIDTEVNRKAMPTSDSSKWPRPEEIARVILFLCSDDAKLIHGAAIPVYGAS